MKNLTTQQLGRRSGSGLKISGAIYQGRIFDFFGTVNNQVCFGDTDFSRNFEKIELIKPVLYSHEWLTKEITHEGEKFVPLHKIYGRNIGFVKCFEDRKEYVLVEGSSDKPIITYFPKDLTVWEHWKIELLISWHFVIDETPDQYVAVTDEFNPYVK